MYPVLKQFDDSSFDLLQIGKFGIAAETFVSREDSTTEKAAVRIEDFGDHVSVGTNSESADVEFENFRHIFEEVHRPGSQPRVVPGTVGAKELEMEDILNKIE